jgi:hypothetical protein
MNKSYRNVELSWPERFMHICSIEDKRYEIFPCNNDISISSCESSCDQTKASIQFQCLKIIECLYRLSRINWIPEVIKLANDYDKHVMSWSEECKDKNDNIVKKHYIRYMSGMHDFLIILGERKMKGNVYYSFITAFPVFLKRESYQLMQGDKKSYKMFFSSQTYGSRLDS